MVELLFGTIYFAIYFYQNSFSDDLYFSIRNNVDIHLKITLLDCG